jgi:membrane protein implicated in regulation of membrane protease activity
MWAEWWAWLAGALVLAALEVVLPSYVFLGFAIGAAATGLVLLVGGPFAAALAGSFPFLALFFALASLAGWVALRRALGVRRNQVKTFERDINDD